jgi:hypothetical protein
LKRFAVEIEQDTYALDALTTKAWS